MLGPIDDVELRVRRERLKELVVGHRTEAVRLGRFVLESRIGSGGMGTVYAAHDPDLQRRVAVKVMREELPQGRLLEEARTLAKLSHPNVVPVHEVGQHEGRVFIVMELIGGQDLGGWLGSSRRPWRQIVRTFAEAGRGLAAAHAAGIVHRDFKPDNVLLDDLGHVRVADFGLALVPEGESIAASTGSGTPRDLAPELERGQRADAASDQYAFCSCTFEALFGPDARVIGRAPRTLRRVLGRGMSEQPSRRWPSMSALLGALDSASRSPFERWAVPVLGLATTLVVASAFVSEDPCRDGERRIEAVWDGDTSTTSGAALEAYARRWVSIERAVCSRGVSSPAATACLERHLSAFANLIAFLEDDPRPESAKSGEVEYLPAVEVCADLSSGGLDGLDEDVERQLTEARGLGGLGKLPEAEARFDAALEDARASGNRRSLAHALSEAALLRVFLERPAEALALYDEAYWLANASGLHADAGRAAAMIAFLLSANENDQERAARWVDLSLGATAHEDVLAADRVFVLVKAAAVAHFAGRLREALALCEEATSMMDGMKTPSPLDLFGVIKRQADVLSDLGRPDEAARLIQRSRPEAVKTFGEGHPNVALHDESLGHALFEAGRFEEAKSAFRAAFEGIEAGHLRQRRADLQMLIALAQSRAGRTAEALPAAEHALSDIEASYGSTASDDLAWGVTCLADVRYEAGDIEGARASVERALELFSEIASPEPVLVLAALEVFVRVHGPDAPPSRAALARGEAIVNAQPEDVRPKLMRALRGDR